jgi:hypothetical protein
MLTERDNTLRLALASWLVISRCPWCGYSIRKMISGIEKSFARKLLDKIRRYLD